MEQIREVNIEKNEAGEYKKVRVVFGPHFMLEVTDTDGKIEFSLVATHHGFRADASEVNGELETIINDVKKKHPGNEID